MALWIPPSRHLLRFDAFEVDLRTGELRKGGARLKIQEQPLKVLAMLLARPGELVTREELCKELWSDRTFVDFERGLNTAVNRLRGALNDSAEEHRFVETVGKRGYRFIAPVKVSHYSAPPNIEVTAVDRGGQGTDKWFSRSWQFVVGVFLSLACLLAAWPWIRHHDARAPGPEFQRLTFGRGTILSARFAADGRSIIYGAAWDGKPFLLFWVNTRNGESRSLGVDGDVLAISPSGEMAVLMDPSVRLASRRGTLAIVSLTGGAPRKLLDNVQDADWTPDGSKMVITHYVHDHCVLEFPPGQVLYETTGETWLSNPRISPRGDQIAFLEHPLGRGDDDAGWVALVDVAGHKKTLSGEFGSISGVAWDPAADTIWFSGIEPAQSTPRSLFTVTTAGQQRLVRRESGNLTLQDVSQDGHLLLTHDTLRGEVFGRTHSENQERELGWGDQSMAMDLTPDGATVLLSVQGEASGTGSAVYLRNTEGSPAVRLGEGLPVQFWPDGKWVVTTYPSNMQPTSPPQLLLLPTGAGPPPLALTHDSISHGFATLLADQKRLVFEGWEPGRAPRNWIQDVSGGKPMPITPEGTVGKWVSPDGKALVALDPEQKFWVYPIDAGKRRPLSGIEPGEDPICWSADGNALFVASGNTTAVRVYCVQITTGERKLLYTLAPTDAAGIWNIAPVLLTPDGKSYAYSDYRILSDLYLTNGLR